MYVCQFLGEMLVVELASFWNTTYYVKNRKFAITERISRGQPILHFLQKSGVSV